MHPIWMRKGCNASLASLSSFFDISACSSLAPFIHGRELTDDRARGFKRVHSVELADNRSAIGLEEEMGFTARPCAEEMSLTLLTKRLGD